MYLKIFLIIVNLICLKFNNKAYSKFEYALLKERGNIMKKLFLPLFILVLALSGCEGNSYLNNDYTITYETFGGTEIESIELSLEAQINKPVEPIKDDYLFDGWYSDEDLTSVFDFPSLAY